MICPEQSCGAYATAEVVSTTPCEVWESVKFAGAEAIEIEFTELIDFVEVRCTEGHTFRGPFEFFREEMEEWPKAA